MEHVIDDLFLQTQNNIDTIYRNGLENMDIETYRSDTVTPDTCMRRLEEDLMLENSNVEKPDVNATGTENDKPESENDEKQSENQFDRERKKPALPTRPPPPTPACFKQNPDMDSLLNEVSIWAQDRQKWLLDKDDKNIAFASTSREDTLASVTTEGMAINQVKRSNQAVTAKQRVSNWVNDQSDQGEADKGAVKASGILTGPTLFRTTPRYPKTPRPVESRGETFGGVDNKKALSIPTKSESTRSTGPRKRSYKGVTIIDYGNDDTEVVTDAVCEANADKKEDPHLGYSDPWTSDMYKQDLKEQQQNLNCDIDSLSDFDGSKKANGKRSPDSWLSSNESESRLKINERNQINDGDDCYELPDTRRSPFTTSNVTPTLESPRRDNVVRATNVGKSLQIERKAPKVHSFKQLERHFSSPQQTPVYVKPIMKNTQLKPLSSQRSVQHPSNLDSFPALPGMKKTSHSFQNTLNIGDRELSLSKFQGMSPRPFSEIPLRPNFVTDRNSNILASRVNLPQGPDESHPVIQAMLRPVSEMVPSSGKRHDKIGVGPIMATKEKQAYAQSIAHNMERQRLQPNNEAFRLQDEINGEPQGTRKGDKINGGTEKVSATTRHKVFTQGLLDGGYNYNKHSRNRKHETTGDNSSFSEINTSDSPRLTNHTGSKSPLTASVNDLLVSINDPQGHNENGMSLSQSSESQTSGKDTNQKLQRHQSMHVHSLSANIQHFGANGDNSQTNKTADKFRKLRTRRDQEMEWLMKDAAETEV